MRVTTITYSKKTTHSGKTSQIISRRCQRSGLLSFLRLCGVVDGGVDARRGKLRLPRMELMPILVDNSQKRSRRLLIKEWTFVLAMCTMILAQQADAEFTGSDMDFQRFQTKRYRLMIPLSWKNKQKAGADALFENPDRPSTNIGITVAPVKVRSLADFGTLQEVAARLLDAEKKKDGFISVALLSQQQQSRSGSVFYSFDYELNSTRGRKRVLNVVTIMDYNLLIFNGQHKCEKDACSSADQAAVASLRYAAETFDANNNE